MKYISIGVIYFVDGMFIGPGKFCRMRLNILCV